ncbi:tRNA (cytosine(38)-C(5))-methyltransferase-like [Condylostylus longicornis]|uniref:tRNA (cytosine(38)-C(5))-methyltransferase-like n=1 Tax=Condylostylus longicornis TaxID=2530218 RepID=UPI00244E340F|nr:tRNA (cytosine(38)-C(5))-methyltransferase-like [Condylostylus longicornis]
MKVLKVAELFSGIGGMHCGLKLWEESQREAGRQIGCEVTLAMDFSERAREVYKYNFPTVTPSSRNVTAQSLQFWIDLNVDVWMLSPPCQPYTRQGLKKESKDIRSNSLSYLLNIIEELPEEFRPRCILLENVHGFESSDMRDATVKTLSATGYQVREFLLTPIHFGVPNFRLRYFLCARRFDEDECLTAVWSQGVNDTPAANIIRYIPGFDGDLNWCCPIDPISRFLDKNIPPIADREEDEEIMQQLILSLERKVKNWGSIDLVRASDKHTCCFTKAYGKYLAKTGSVLLLNEAALDWKTSTDTPLREVKDYITAANASVRLFSANEMLRLHCFPTWFTFPPNMQQERPKMMLIGNSLNVRIVSFLCGFLFDGIGS